MKNVRTCLIAAALTGAVLTVSAAAAPVSITVIGGNAAQALSQCQNGSFPLNLPEILANCPELNLPGQMPSLPGGDVIWPGQTPDSPDADQSVPGGETAVSRYEAEVVRLVNEARQENGLKPLTSSGELSRVARAKSQDMADNRYFSHTSPTYGTPFEMLKTFGISYSSAGENIAYGQRTPQEVVSGWMNPPGHRANILNASYTQIGVGYVANGNYWTQLFIG